VVDDDRVSLKLLARIFRSQLWAVESCESAEAASRALEEGSFDILVTDHQMPVMSGLELVRRTQLLVPTLPCIIVSGCARPPDAVGTVWLPKPVEVESLVAAIRGLQVRHRPETEAPAKNA
jgi:DNA-binding response OmpR family regulator